MTEEADGQSVITSCTPKPTLVQTDHELVRTALFVGVDNPTGTNRLQLQLKLRKIDIEASCDSLHKQELGKFNDESDIDAMWLSWSEKFQRVLDAHAPAVAQRRRDKKPHRICPWSTPQLDRLNHQKLLEHRQLLKTPGDPDLRQRFCPSVKNAASSRGD